MQKHIPVWFIVCLSLATMSVATAQTPDAGPPSADEAIQNNTRMLQKLHANPQAKAQILTRLKETMAKRGITDTTTRLAEIEKIFNETLAMSAANFEKNSKQLATRITSQMRPSKNGSSASSPGAGVPASGGTGDTAATAAATIRWIDVHNHLIAGQHRDFSKAFSAALVIMDQIGISTMFVMPPPQTSTIYDYDAFVSALRKNSTRFAFLGGGGSLNVMIHQAAGERTINEKMKQQFKQKADEVIRQGAAGFGEMAIQHLSLHGTDHPYENVAADHPLLLLLSDIAAQHDVPIDIHLDVITNDIPTPASLASPNNPKILHANVAAFDRLLDHNPKTRICWDHVGSDNTGHWTADLSRGLLKKHPNLYMSFRVGPGNEPGNFPLTRDGQLKPEWLSLLKDFPDRFMIGSDNFIASASFKGSGTAASLASKVPATRKLTPVFLNNLPADLARKVAFENAVTVYKLKHQ